MATLVSHAQRSSLEVIANPADVLVGQRGTGNLPENG